MNLVKRGIINTQSWETNQGTANDNYEPVLLAGKASSSSIPPCCWTSVFFNFNLLSGRLCGGTLDVSLEISPISLDCCCDFAADASPKCRALPN
jgi:hypothetical protein